MEIRTIRDQAELEEAFNLAGSLLPHPIDTTHTHRFDDLARRFPYDRPLMLVATADGPPVGAALALRTDDRTATLRMIAVVEAFRGRGIGRRLVEGVEIEARLVGVERIVLGTDEAVGFWYHLGYVPNLLLQWVYDAEVGEEKSAAVLTGPLAGLRHWRSSFNGVPQLYVELDELRIELPDIVRGLVTGCHVGFMMAKQLSAS